jgi:hypothetical protein
MEVKGVVCGVGEGDIRGKRSRVEKRKGGRGSRIKKGERKGQS